MLLKSVTSTKSIKYASSLSLMLATLIPLVVYLFAKIFIDHTFDYSDQHFYTVSIISVLTAILATFIAIIGTRLRNFQIVLVAFSYSSLGILFALRSFEMVANMTSNIVHFATPLGFLSSALWLLLSSFPAESSFASIISRFGSRLILVCLVSILTLVLIFLNYAELLNQLPTRLFELSFWFSGIIMLLYVWIAWRYYQHYRYTRAPLHYTIVQSSLWIASAQIMIATSTEGDISCWILHGLLLAAASLMIAGFIKQYKWSFSSFNAIFNRDKNDLKAKIEAALSPNVRQLIRKTEEHDLYTAGHNWRVAMLAVQIGECMGLAPEQLHALAYAGVIHDIGKLNVPARILNKAGKLSQNEREIIEQHPKNGHALCKLLGFMPEELAIVKHHHEKWDGTGYPAKLTGEQIPLVARITAVADVYDALTSKRAYREPMTPEEAHTFILERSGSHFCPESVKAWTVIHTRAQFNQVQNAKEPNKKLRLTLA